MVIVRLFRGIVHEGEGGSFGVADELFNVVAVVQVFHAAVFLAVVEQFDVIGCR